MAEIHAFWQSCIGGKLGGGGAPIQTSERGKPPWGPQIAVEGYCGSRAEMAQERPSPRARAHIRE